MFTQAPTTTTSRFAALAFRLTPHTIHPARQAQAAQLAPTVKAIRPGVYIVGGQHYIDLWHNICTCREHRVKQITPCRHRLALWLAEGVDIDDPDPALYLKSAGVEQPAIIAWYATVNRWAIGQPRTSQARWLGGDAWQLLETGETVLRAIEDTWYLTPFYE